MLDVKRVISDCLEPKVIYKAPTLIVLALSITEGHDKLRRHNESISVPEAPSTYR
jgi:hypothetical protein